MPIRKIRKQQKEMEKEHTSDPFAEETPESVVESTGNLHISEVYCGELSSESSLESIRREKTFTG